MKEDDFALAAVFEEAAEVQPDAQQQCDCGEELPPQAAQASPDNCALAQRRNQQ